MAHWDHVDIGTCDFDTSADNHPNDKILLVEPLEEYLIKYKDMENVTCCAAAISDRFGIANIYYIDQDDIKRCNLPNWLKGCSAINIQPYSLIWAESRGCITRTKSVQVITFKDLCERYDISSIGSLKVDTEGHDHIVMAGVLESIDAGMIIKDMKIEFDRSLDQDYLDAMHKIFERLESFGYEKKSLPFDMYFRLTDTNKLHIL